MPPPKNHCFEVVNVEEESVRKGIYDADNNSGAKVDVMCTSSKHCKIEI